MEIDICKIRNFCIIAHIDHGKSTLADRMLEITGTIKRIENGQVLDKMDLEKERGITIKLAPVRMYRKGYELNLIDTPGHVDFQYEVSRSLASVEGAVLLIDATQGIQAQTLSTLYMALDYGLEIIPVLNKIDLSAARPERITEQIENLLGIPSDNVLKVSAKTGKNVEKVLDAIIERIPNPKIFKELHRNKFYKKQFKGVKGRSLIFDSIYDKFRGVVVYVRVIDGEIKSGEEVKLLHSKVDIKPLEVGYFSPGYVKDDLLREGQIGYIVTGLKSVRQARVGDTILKLEKHKERQYGCESDTERLLDYSVPGFKKVKPFIYAGVYPLNSQEYEKLREGVEKLSLNDSSIVFESEFNKALGQGFRIGFLGTLHMEIVKERLQREYKIETVFTTPSVVYLVGLKNYSLVFKFNKRNNILSLLKGDWWKYILEYLYCFDKLEFKDYKKIFKYFDEEEFLDYVIKLLEKSYYDLDKNDKIFLEEILKKWIIVRSGTDMPDKGDIEVVLEPIAKVDIVGPKDFSGNIMELAQEYRGILRQMRYIDSDRILWEYKIPIGEMIVDFYDKLKGLTKGYATMNYKMIGYEPNDLVRIDILINKQKVEPFSLIVHKSKTYKIGKFLVERLKELIPRHLFPIPIQATVGTSVIARETIPPLKKDVLAKCYGGDVTRKRKLLQKQKEGKKKLAQIGKVCIPSDIFIKMLQR